jgi:hypothetical protein
MMRASSLHPSSLRKQGPITTGPGCVKRLLPSCHIETARRMGPRVRGDDGDSRRPSRQTALSSPGSTGRSSTPRRLGSISGASPYLAPLAGRGRRRRTATSPGEGDSPRVLLCREAPSPQPSPRKRGEGAHLVGSRPSSPGLTGRSSTPRPLDSISAVSGILDPRFRGDDELWVGIAIWRDGTDEALAPC